MVSREVAQSFLHEALRNLSPWGIGGNRQQDKQQDLQGKGRFKKANVNGEISFLVYSVPPASPCPAVDLSCALQ